MKVQGFNSGMSWTCHNLYCLQLWPELSNTGHIHTTILCQHKTNKETHTHTGLLLYHQGVLLLVLSHLYLSSLVTALVSVLKMFYLCHCVSYLFLYCHFLMIVCVVKPCVTVHSLFRSSLSEVGFGAFASAVSSFSTMNCHTNMNCSFSCPTHLCLSDQWPRKHN